MGTVHETYSIITPIFLVHKWKQVFHGCSIYFMQIFQVFLAKFSKLIWQTCSTLSRIVGIKAAITAVIVKLISPTMTIQFAFHSWTPIWQCDVWVCWEDCSFPYSGFPGCVWWRYSYNVSYIQTKNGNCREMVRNECELNVVQHNFIMK